MYFYDTENFDENYAMWQNMCNVKKWFLSNLVVVSETINAHNMWLTKNNNIKSKTNTFNSFSWWILFLFVLNWKENYRIIIKKKHKTGTPPNASQKEFSNSQIPYSQMDRFNRVFRFSNTNSMVLSTILYFL